MYLGGVTQAWHLVPQTSPHLRRLVLVSLANAVDTGGVSMVPVGRVLARPLTAYWFGHHDHSRTDHDFWKHENEYYQIVDQHHQMIRLAEQGSGIMVDTTSSVDAVLENILCTIGHGTAAAARTCGVGPALA